MVGFPFRLTDAANTFVRLMNEVLKTFLGKFFIVYLDNILIFNRSLEEHLEHVRIMLERWKEEKMLIKLKKYTSLQEELVYLGFVVSKEDLKLDPEKVKAIVYFIVP